MSNDNECLVERVRKLEDAILVLQVISKKRNTDHMLTVSEAATLLNISRDSFHKYRKQGLIKPLKVEGETKFSYDELNRFMKRVKQ